MTGNGVLFTDYTSGALADADDDVLYRARRYARRPVRYWDKPAKQYLDLMYDLKEIISP